MDTRDEFMHPVLDERGWSESYYFNFYDPRAGVGMFTRMGFRPGDGWADGLHAVYLGGDHVAFTYGRKDLPELTDDLQVEGLKLERIEPFKRWAISYEGPAQDIEDASILVTRRRGRPEGWFKPATLSMRVEFEALAEPHHAAEGRRGHFEQTGHVMGTIRLGDREWQVDGHGVRDKSWGPRNWQATGKSWGGEMTDEVQQEEGPRPFVTWFSGNWGGGMAFGAAGGADAEGNMRGAGWWQRDGKTQELTSVRMLDSTYRPGSILHTGLTLEGVAEDGSDFKAKCDVIGICPTKIPQRAGATFVNEGLARFELDGQTGYGIAEYWHSVTDD